MNLFKTESYKMFPGESVLLLDESVIESERGIDRNVQVGEKIPFVVEPDADKPWEHGGPGMSRRVHLYGTVLYDDLVGKFRMWYFCRMGPHWRVPSGNYQSVTGEVIRDTSNSGLAAGDINGDGQLNVVDIVQLVNLILG